MVQNPSGGFCWVRGGLQEADAITDFSPFTSDGPVMTKEELKAYLMQEGQL